MTPTLYVSARYERLEDALHDAQERGALEFQLPRQLQAQRWFGGQARALQSARLERWTAIETEGGPVMLCVVVVTDDTGLETEHLLLLATAEASGDQRAVVDASGLGPARRALLGLALSDGRSEGYRLELVCERVAEGVEVPASDGRLAGVEQSNTSIIYDDRYILKLYRRLERGHNPEVEIVRYLTTEADLDVTPRLVAIGRLESADGYRTDALMVQEYVPNEGDGFAWAVGAAREAISGAERMGDWLEREGTTLRLAEALGKVTARMHAALARAESEDMRPEPAGREDLEGWASGLREEAQETAQLLRRTSLDDPGVLDAVERASALPTPSLDRLGLKVRVHGDYHLGQVLKSGDRFYVIDFEGEPARSLAERHVRQHPLVDVAGMARSWAYAAHTSAVEAGDDRSELAGQWEAAVRRRFLDAYFREASASNVGLLPPEGEARDALLSLFELRKALYEIRYELNNRPSWVAIPASAVRHLVEALQT